MQLEGQVSREVFFTSASCLRYSCELTDFRDGADGADCWTRPLTLALPPTRKLLGGSSTTISKCKGAKCPRTYILRILRGVFIFAWGGLQALDMLHMREA